MAKDTSPGIYKRFLRAGFFVKREGHGYWLGHYCEEGNRIVRMRITPKTYRQLLVEVRVCRIVDRLKETLPQKR